MVVKTEPGLQARFSCLLLNPMKSKTLTLVLACLAWSLPGHAEEASVPDYLKPSLMDQAFVVETSEEDMNDSLNRISGDDYRGYAPEEYTYKSSNHYKGGPFGRQDTFDNSEQYGY
jgi:hypothetical protein